MKREKDNENNPAVGRQFSAIRTGFAMAAIVVLLLIGFLWFESYRAGRKWYRSVWSETDTVKRERANWLFSNYGSFAIAWRRQEGELGSSLPENAREFAKFPASRSALGHIHPEGIWAWHWFYAHSKPPAMMGAMQHDYGHLFVPYWIPFLGCMLLLISLNTQKEQDSGAISTSLENEGQE